MGPAHKHRSSANTITKLPSKIDPFLLPPKLETPGNPSTSSDTEEKNPLPNHHDNSSHNNAFSINVAEEDSVFGDSEFLTREEVIRRRLRRVKQLEKCYKVHYWALMEEIRVQYREYYWKYGKSPFIDEEETEKENGGSSNGVEGSGETNYNHSNNSKLGLVLGKSSKRCVFAGCKGKAMALTNYCHSHILSDRKQKLYKACTYIIKSAQTGPVHCGKPILRATVPSLCTVHFKKAQKHVKQALKRAGLNMSSSNKLAPKFHVIVADSVHQINAKRRERRETIDNVVVKEENGG